MIKSIIKCAFALILTLSAVSLVAQPGHKTAKKMPTPAEVAQMRTDRIDKAVVLTEKQKKDVYALFLKQAEEFAAAKAAPKDKNVDPAVKKAEFAKERAERTAQLEKILTPEQAAKWKEVQAQQKAAMKAKRECKAKGECTKCECKTDCAKSDCKKECCKTDCKKECAKSDCKKDCPKADCKKDCPKK